MKFLKCIKSVLIGDAFLRATFVASILWLIYGVFFYLKELGVKGECIFGDMPSWLAWWITICLELGAPIFTTERALGSALWGGPCTIAFSTLGFFEFLTGPFIVIWIVGGAIAWARNPDIFSGK